MDSTASSVNFTRAAVFIRTIAASWCPAWTPSGPARRSSVICAFLDRVGPSHRRDGEEPRGACEPQPGARPGAAETDDGREAGAGERRAVALDVYRVEIEERECDVDRPLATPGDLVIPAPQDGDHGRPAARQLQADLAARRRGRRDVHAQRTHAPIEHQRERPRRHGGQREDDSLECEGAGHAVS
jgi:hypothetical protein